jgi:hypothetical protein
MRVDAELRVDPIRALASGVRCKKYTAVSKMLVAVRSRLLAQELAEDIESDPGPVYLINYKALKVIVLPDHVHVIGVETEEEAKKVVEELAGVVQRA